MKKYIFLMVALISSLGVWAYNTTDVTIDNIGYRIYFAEYAGETNHAVVYTNSSGTELPDLVTIPATITYNDINYDVTSVEYWRYGKEVSLSLPSSILSIDLCAIESDIATLTLSSSVTSVTQSSLNSSYGNARIAAYAVASGNTSYSSEAGVLFNVDKTTLIYYPHRKSDVVYELPSTVKSIGDYAFYDVDKIEKVVLPSGLTTIGYYAFSSCNNLTNCAFPESLTDIKDYAFEGCKLAFDNNTLVLPSSLSNIGQRAFFDAFLNNSSYTVEFPSTLGQDVAHVYVGSYAFNCSVIRAKMQTPSASSYDAFDYVSKIYVPQGRKDAYVAVNGWGYNNSSVADKIQESSSSTDIPGLEKVAQPTITETISGSYMNLTFATTTSEATIRYKIFSGIDNSDPVDWDIYDNTSKSISSGQTVKVIALKSGMNNSEITQKTYDFSSMTCKKPSINFNQTDIIISMTTATEGADIYYTTDGTVPSKTNGTKYESAIIPTANNVSYRAVAVKEGMFDSNISDECNTGYFFTCPSVVIDQVVVGGAPKMKLTLAETNIDVTGVKIYYKIDNYYWNDNDWIQYGDLYSEPVYVSNGSSIYAVAIKDGYTMSNRSGKTMDYSGFTKCSSPSIVLDNDNKTISITTTEPYGKIYYTVDGSIPTTESTLYTAPFTSGTLCTVMAITARDAETSGDVTTIYANSDVVSRSLEDWFRLEDVVFEPQFGDEAGVYKMKMSHPEEGVTIMYYTDGNRWSEDYSMANEYDGSVITVDVNTYIHAYAKKDGKVNSYWNYMYIDESGYTVSRPSIQTNDETKMVSMSSTTPGATIYYTLDNTDPSVSETRTEYKESFALGGNYTIKAVAVKSGMNSSDVEERTISNWYRVSDVVMNIYVKDNNLMCEFSTKDAEDGITFYYSAGDWGGFSTTNNYTLNSVYSGPFKISKDLYVRCAAVKANYNAAVTDYKWVSIGSYTCNSPEITARSTDSTVVISCSTEGATIYYTNDGTDPTVDNKFKYTDGTTIKLDRNCTFKAFAVKDKMFNSDISERRISDWFRCENVTFEQILDGTQPKMKMTSTPGSTIYYSFNGYSLDSVYKAPIVVDDGRTVYSKAIKDGYNDSDWRYQSMSYADYEKCEEPTFEGNSSENTVTITSIYEDAKIYYTLDGRIPTESDSLYKEPIKLDKNCNVRAIVTNGTLVNSLAGNYYVSWFSVDRVKFIPVLLETEEGPVYKVCLKTDTENAKIYYGINNYDYNTENNILYQDGDSIDVAEDQRIYAKAVREDYNDSGWYSFNVNKNNYTVDRPNINLDGETRKAYLTSSVEDAVFYYTIDGTTPTKNSLKYPSTGIDVQGNWTIKAIATRDGMLDSEMLEYEINGWFRVSNVVIDMFVEENKLKAKLSTTDKEPGVKLYYYQGGWSDFDTENLQNNSLYTGAFDVKEGVSYVSAMAVKDYYNNSEISRSYINFSEHTCQAPSINVNYSDTTFTLRCSTTDATIYYTLDESDPATSTTRKQCTTNSTFKITSNFTVTAMAMKSGMINSSTNSVNTVNYITLRTQRPTFTLDDLTVTIKSESANAKIYYSIGDNNVSTSSTLYTGPFKLADNRTIYAIAVHDGWTDSDVSEYTPQNVVQCPAVTQVSFDGHYLTLSAIDDAVIYYTTDGSQPQRYQNYNWETQKYEYTYRGTLYEDKIAINSTGSIIAKAFHPYMTDSESAVFEVKSFAGESGAITESAGGLEASMGWSKPETIEEFTIEGPINSADMNFIKTKMTSLKKLDLSNANAEDGIIPDNAFAGLPIITFSSPNSLTSIGNNIFSDCKELAAVVWNTTAKIPDNAFDADVNPNLLVFVPTQDAAPANSSARNIIVNNTADNIYLSDGDDNNFCSPMTFYARHISYTHDFKLKSGNGAGWETIVLPFTCNTFVHESDMELKPFAVYNENPDEFNYKPFWLRELKETGFEDAKSIEANKPYIICMPNNDSYATRFRLGGKVTFSAVNTYVVETTTPGEAQKGGVTLYANYLNKAETDNLLLLNTVVSGTDEPGSVFIRNSGRALRPFEAYVVSRSNARAAISITRGFSDDPDGDDDTTPIETVNQQTTGKMVKVYTLSGVLVKEAAEEDALKGLAKGVYIVNGKSMIVK